MEELFWEEERKDQSWEELNYQEGVQRWNKYSFTHRWLTEA